MVWLRGGAAWTELERRGALAADVLRQSPTAIRCLRRFQCETDGNRRGCRNWPVRHPSLLPNSRSGGVAMPFVQKRDRIFSDQAWCLRQRRWWDIPGGTRELIISKEPTGLIVSVLAAGSPPVTCGLLAVAQASAEAASD